ncbi:MAG TPA: NAD(P)-dependent oxidoreductase [Chloroflexia bacterium]|nr:NAD(P)-dependent oxidoreductase [Chloroflexia bacterium]
MKVGLVGTGAMGLPMGRRLLEGGHELYVVPHVNHAPAEELIASGAHLSAYPSDLAGECEVVVTSVPDVPQVQEVLFGEHGLATGSGRNLLYIDTSTINPTAAREHHKRLAEQGIEALDAPVSGGPARAADGTLTIMVGGTREAFERGMPVFGQLGAHIIHVGDPGAGQAVKLVNQLMISIIMVANAEALTLGVKAGVPLEVMTEVIGTASGSNYLMQSWLPKTLFAGKLDGGFALDLLMKDLSASIKWAADMGVPVFGGALAQQLYRLAQTEGLGRMDYSAVARIYEGAAGVEIRNGQNA